VLADFDWRDPDARVTGGESSRQVYDRMAAVLGPLAARGDRDVVLVSHGDSIRLALAGLSGHGPSNAPWVEIGNGAVFAIDRGAMRSATTRVRLLSRVTSTR
jgi:probable phosphoglycerate mutase